MTAPHAPGTFERNTLRPRPWPRFVDYLIAVAATAVALLLRAAFDPWVGADYPLGFLLGAVGVAMWFGGIRAAVLSVVVGSLKKKVPIA